MLCAKSFGPQLQRRHGPRSIARAYNTFLGGKPDLLISMCKKPLNGLSLRDASLVTELEGETSLPSRRFHNHYTVVSFPSCMSTVYEVLNSSMSYSSNTASSV